MKRTQGIQVSVHARHGISCYDTPSTKQNLTAPYMSASEWCSTARCALNQCLVSMQTLTRIKTSASTHLRAHEGMHSLCDAWVSQVHWLLYARLDARPGRSAYKRGMQTIPDLGMTGGRCEREEGKGGQSANRRERDLTGGMLVHHVALPRS